MSMTIRDARRIGMEKNDTQSIATATADVTPAGSTAADATPVGPGRQIVTGADGTKGVLLPAAARGVSTTILNVTNAVLKVWPRTGGKINALSTDAAISMAANTSATFDAVDTVQWWTSPRVPS